MTTDTRFQPGNAGGPGRPRDAVKTARRVLQPHIAALVEQRLAAALRGDGEAADAVIRFYAMTSNRLTS